MKQNLFSIEGKTAIVTGGRQGIGKVISNYLADAGANIVIVDIKDASFRVKEIEDEFGVKAFFVMADVANKNDVRAMMKEVEKLTGAPDILFNNAGICVHKPSLELEDGDWERVIDVNLSGVFYTACEFARCLIANNKGGSIINMASMSATIVNIPQRQAAYNASKAGVVHLTKSLAVEWIDKNIRVNCISPGYTKTEMTGSVRQDWQDTWVGLTPKNRMCNPGELAGAVIYLASDASSFTNGCDIIIDGGYSIV